VKLATVLLAVALIDPLVQVDHAVRDAVQGVRSPALERPMRALTDGGKPLVVVSGLLAVALLDASAGVPTARGCLAVLAPVNLMVEGMKYGFGRVRPDAGDDHRRNSSFPSSHSANAMALAWMLSRRWPKWTPGFFLLGALVGFSRIYLDRHFLSDVLVGAAVGIVISWLVVRAWPVLDPARIRRVAPRPAPEGRARES
jgi:undecaprenyl-diphosphatase